MKTDTLFYRLFQDRPALLFELTGLPWRDAAGYVWRAEEVKEAAFRLDGVLVPEADSDAPLVFTEVQFQHDPDFYGRWLSEICLYLYRRKVQRPWRAVVLFPTAAEDPGPGPAFAPLAVPPQVSRCYLVPILATAKASGKPLGPGLGVIDLILTKPAASPERARELMRGAAEAERDWLLTWVETILVYKLPKLSREDIKMLLDLKDPDLRRSRFFQEVFAEGHDEGLDLGKRAEARALVLRQLRRRFGDLRPAAAALFEDLPLARLEALAEDLLDFADAADLDAWLKRESAGAAD
jgi:predicted transposase YdaD